MSLFYSLLFWATYMALLGSLIIGASYFFYRAFGGTKWKMFGARRRAEQEARLNAQAPHRS